MKKIHKLTATFLSAALCLWMLAGCRKPAEPTATEPPAATNPPRDPFSAMESTVLYDENNIQIVAQSLEQTILGAEIQVLMTNRSAETVSFIANDLIVNGLTFNDGFSISAKAGQSTEGVIKISYRSLDAAQMRDIATVKSPDAQIIRNEDFTALYDAPFEIKTAAAASYKAEIPNQGTVLYEKNGIRIAALGIKSLTRTSTIHFLVTNADSEAITVKGSNYKADGKDVSTWIFDTVYPGTSRYCVFELGSAEIGQVSLDIDIYSAGEKPEFLYSTGNHTISATVGQ